MLKQLSGMGLLGLLVWNALLGGVGGMAVCLHADGSFHTASSPAADDHGPCSDRDGACTPCVDFELPGEVLPLVRAQESPAPQAPAPSAVLPASAELFPHPPLNQTADGAVCTGAGPPGESTALQVARTVVLRL